jgi:hypothetical protein
MYELRVAANLYEVEKAYREPLLKSMVEGIKPGETERLWSRQSFFKRPKYN